ncbi:MAG: hypothetical protein IKI91_05530 [Clostridia bacterium]|nr:hypothetical protein [Clostridia bacterium]
MSKKHPTGDEGNRDSFFSKLFRPETDEEEKIVPDGAEAVSDDDPFGFEFEEAPREEEDPGVFPGDGAEAPAEIMPEEFVGDVTPAEPAEEPAPAPRRRRGRPRRRTEEDVIGMPEAEEEIPAEAPVTEELSAEAEEVVAEAEEVAAEAEEAVAETEEVVDETAEHTANIVADVADPDGEERPDPDSESPAAEDFEAGEMEPDENSPRMGSTDLNLRIAFGLEDAEEEESVRKKMKRMADRNRASKRAGRPVKLDCPEFTDPMQAKTIAAGYRRDAKVYNVKLVLAMIFTAILLIYENIPTLTKLFTGSAKQFSGVLDPAAYPVVYIMMSLQILFIVCLLGFREIKTGLRRMFLGNPGALTLTSVFVGACTVYSVVMAIIAESRNEPVLYNAVAALAVTMAIFCARLDNKREMETFYVTGSRREKYVMRRLPEGELLNDEDAFEDEDGEPCEIMKIEKTGFVDSFFTRMRTPDPSKNTFIVSIISVSAALALLAGGYVLINSHSVRGAVTVALLLILALVPISAFLTFSYPFFRAAGVAKSYDSAIVGDVSLNEYADASVVAFDDDNIFPSVGVKVQNIRIYNNARIDRVLYYAASVFAHAGGPLADIFEIATMDMTKSERVEIADADRGYLATVVDGVNILFGEYEELRRRGVAIPEEVAVDDVDFSDEMSIMYMVREDKLVSKLYIKYDLDTDIEPVLKQFGDSGMYMCVRTFDPNINEDMIASKTDLKDPPVKVVRYREESEVDSVSERADSGLVASGSPKSLLQIIPCCDNTVRTKRDCVALGIVSSIIGGLVVLLMSITGGLGHLSSLLVAAYQAVWLIPAFLISKLFVR